MKQKKSPLFLPPKLNPVLTRCCQSISYIVAAIFYQMKLKVEQSDIESIKALGDARIIYLPNHPTFDDGIALFMFSAINGQLFHYLVARDSFQGWLANFLPLIGCYSMRRGIGDRHSITQTIQLIRQPQIRLVIFPEGGCSYQNDTVIPFRTGAVAMAFQAMAKLIKEEKNFSPIYLIPLSLKYRYLQPMNNQIEKTLSRLEKALNIIKDNEDFYQRLRNIGQKILTKIANDYEINEQLTWKDHSWTNMINLLKNNLLQQCEQKLNMETNSDFPMRERIYQVQASLESKLEQSEKLSSDIETFIKETTFQLLNFDAIYDGYVAEKPEQERFLDTLNRLERSVFKLDKPSAKGTRQAMIKVCKIIDLQDYFFSYQKNKVETIENLTHFVQESVQHHLNLNDKA
jgi:1-acyl-sn-glycerol-3-phosphate acyltransferase